MAGLPVQPISASAILLLLPAALLLTRLARPVLPLLLLARLLSAALLLPGLLIALLLLTGALIGILVLIHSLSFRRLSNAPLPDATNVGGRP